MASFPVSTNLVLSDLQRNRIGSENPSDVFRFLVEERIQCCQTRKVRYTERVDYLMQLPVAMEAATNKGNSPEREKSHVCLPASRPAPEIGCPVTGMHGLCLRCTALFIFSTSPCDCLWRWLNVSWQALQRILDRDCFRTQKWGSRLGCSQHSCVVCGDVGRVLSRH